MRRTIARSGIAGLLVLGCAGAATAATLTIGPGTVIQPTNHMPMDAFVGQGQTFVVPLGFPTLESFSVVGIKLAYANLPDPWLNFELWEWTGGPREPLSRARPCPSTPSSASRPSARAPDSAGLLLKRVSAGCRALLTH
jgi:hypothetical protein